MKEKAPLGFTLFLTVAGVLGQLAAIPYGVRLYGVAAATLVSAAQAIILLARRPKRGGGTADPGGKRTPRELLWPALCISLVCVLVPVPTWFVDQYYAVQINHVRPNGADGVHHVVVTSPLLTTDVHIDLSVSPPSVLRVAPSSVSGRPAADAISADATDVSAQVRLDRFASPQAVDIVAVVDPAYTALGVEATSSADAVTVLTREARRRHVTIIALVGGVLWLGGLCWLCLCR